MKKNYFIICLLFIFTNYAMEGDAPLLSEPIPHDEGELITKFLRLKDSTQNQRKLVANFTPQQQLSILGSCHQLQVDHCPLLNLKKNRLALLQHYALHDENYGYDLVQVGFDEFWDDFKKAYTAFLDNSSYISKEHLEIPLKRKNAVSQLCMSPDGSLLVVGCKRNVYVYDSDSKKWTKNKQKIRTQSIGISQCGKKLAIAGCKGNEIRLAQYDIKGNVLTNVKKKRIPWDKTFGRNDHDLDQKIIFSSDCKKIFFFCNKRLFKVDIENDTAPSFFYSEISPTVNAEGNVAFLKKTEDHCYVEQEVQGTYDTIKSCVADLSAITPNPDQRELPTSFFFDSGSHTAYYGVSHEKQFFNDRYVDENNYYRYVVQHSLSDYSLINIADARISDGDIDFNIPQKIMYCKKEYNHHASEWQVYDLYLHTHFKNISLFGERRSRTNQSGDFFVIHLEPYTMDIYNLTKFNQLRNALQNLTDKQKALVTVAYAHKKKYSPLRIERTTAYTTLPSSLQELLRKKTNISTGWGPRATLDLLKNRSVSLYYKARAIMPYTLGSLALLGTGYYGFKYLLKE